MTDTTAAEKDLRLLLESDPIGEVELRRAEMMLALFPQLAGVTYPEAIKLYQDNEEIYKATPVHDPAYAKLGEWRSMYLRYASAMNIHQKLGRHDHEMPVHALVSVNGITTEALFYIPIYGYYEHQRKLRIEDVIRFRLRRSSRFAGSIRIRPEIDYIEL